MAHKYYFTLTKSNRCKSGTVESEMTFEGVVTHLHDEDTMEDHYDVTAFMTGFTQINDGKKVYEFEGMRIPASRFNMDMEAFNAECIDRAFYEAELKLKAA